MKDVLEYLSRVFSYETVMICNRYMKCDCFCFGWLFYFFSLFVYNSTFWIFQ